MAKGGGGGGLEAKAYVPLSPISPADDFKDILHQKRGSPYDSQVTI